MRKYNAVLIGAGSIGALKPEKFDSPNTRNVLTVAHAFYNHPRINFVGINDVCELRTKQAAIRWNTSDVYHLYLMLELNKIDIIAVCTPTETHYKILNSLYINTNLKNLPKIIMAEKPFCRDLITAQKALTRIEKISIAINYTRRYVPEFQIIKELIDKGKLGTVFSCVIHYDRGLQRDGSHAIDLCNFLFGRFLNGGILWNGTGYNDYADEDLTYPVHMTYEKCGNVFLVPSDGRKYSVFEVDILSEKRRYRFTDHGLEVEVTNVVKEKTYGEYYSLSTKPLKMKTFLNKALMGYVNNVVNFLDGKEELICTAQDAIEQHRVYEYLMKGIL